MELVTFDLDGTLIESTVFQAAADGLGFGDQVRALDAHFFRGTISLEATYYAEYPLFLGYPVEEVHQALSQGTWMGNIGATVDELRSRGLEVWVVTDQPSWAASFLERWGIHQGVWTQASTRGGRVGAVTHQVFEKWPPLSRLLAEHQIAAEQVCHVGNGANDVPVFRRVGASIAFNPSSPEVAEAADAVVEGHDLSRILEHIPA